MLKHIDRLYVNPGPDQGWSWVILAGSFITCALTFGIGTMGGAGILFTEFLKVFDVNRSMASLPFAILGATQSIMGLSVGFLNRVISTRAILFLSSLMCSLSLALCYWATGITYVACIFGMPFGAGLGLANSLTSVITLNYFEKYRSTANAIVSASVPISGIGFPFLVDYLLRKYDLRSAMLLLGAIVFHMMIASSLMRTREPRNFPILIARRASRLWERPPPPPHVTEKKPVAVLVKEYLTVVKNPMFLIITIQGVIVVQGGTGLVQSLPDYMLDCGFSLETATLILSVQAACDLVGRILCGIICDKNYMSKRLLSVCTLLVLTVGYVGLSFSRDIYLLLASITCLGMASGTGNNLINISYYEYMGMGKLFTSVSLRLFFIGISGMLRPVFFGISRDGLGSYKYYYLFIALSTILCSSLWIFEPYLKEKDTTPTEEERVLKRVTLYRLTSKLLPKNQYSETPPEHPDRI